MRFTKKLGLAIGLAAVAAIVIAPLAMAGVVSSNHDMAFKVPANPKAGACSHCHIPHKAGGSKLWAQATTSATSGWQAETISQLCFSCHGGVAYANAQNVNPFETGQHGRTVANLTNGTPPEITALPGDVALAGDGDLKCTSCHDVHNNDHRPFIRFETTAANNYSFASMCLHCHPNREFVGLKGTNNVRNISGANYSGHPTGQTIANTARAVIAGATDFSITPGSNQPGPPSPANSYNSGGHRDNGAAAGNMTCATCHVVHGNETTIYSAADGSSLAPLPITPFDKLGVRDPNPLTVAPYVAPICTGCHANSPTAGPGIATTYSHPIGTARPTWTIPNPPAQTMGYKWGTSGSDDVIVCQTCHDIHFGTPYTSLLYGTVESPTTSSNKNCIQCHPMFLAINHHPVNVPLANGIRTATVARASGPISNWLTFAYTRGGGNYPTVGGNVVCSTCHYQSGAHNNAGTFNQLPYQGANSHTEMCLDCHNVNPSVYSTNSNGHPGSSSVTVDSSHYIGSIMSSTYMKTTTWATTGLSSKWGTVAAGGGDGYIICQSCHTLQLSGTLAGGTTSNNGAGVANRFSASVRTLLEHSGNQNTDTTADLCIGCHGASPAGGGTSAGGTATHPTISYGMSTSASTTVINKIALQVAGTVTLISGTNLVNCESCHRPHDAAQGAGALILEGAGTWATKTAGPMGTATGFQRATNNGGGGYTEEATFCNMCHTY